MNRWCWPALAIFTLGLLLANQSYYRADQRPPAHDEAWYLETSLQLYYAAVDGDWGRFVYHYRTAFLTKAPLVSVLPLPFYLLFGPGPKAALLANSLLLAASNVFLFLMTRRLFSAGVALATVVFYQTMPLAFGLSRLVMTEYGLSALVIAGLYFLVASEDLDRTGANLALGVVMGLGLLMKVLYPAFLAGPLLVVWLRRRRWRPLAAMVLPATLLAGTWYAFNLGSVLEFAWSNAYGDIAAGYGAATLGQRMARAIREGPSLYYTVTLAVLGAAALAMGARRLRLDHRLDQRAWLLAAWMLPPLALILAGRNLEIRFLLPILPGMAILLALATHALGRRPWGRAVLAALVAALPLRVYAGLTFPRLAMPALGVARPPDAEGRWQQERLLAALETLNPPGEYPRYVVVGVEHPYLNANLLSFFNTWRRRNWRFTSLGYAEADAPRAIERLDRLDARFLIMAEGFHSTDLPAFLNRINGEVQARLDRGDLPFRFRARVTLSGDIGARIYERETLWSRLPAAAPSRPLPVEFYGGLRLLGYDWKRKDPRLAEISYYWTAPHPVEEDYRVYVAFERGAATLLRQDDWVAGRRFSPWQAGEIRSQTATVYLPQPGPYQARLWLRAWGAGDRLQVLAPAPMVHESAVPLRLEE